MTTTKRRLAILVFATIAATSTVFMAASTTLPVDDAHAAGGIEAKAG